LKRKLTDMWRHHRSLSVAFVFTAAVTLFFAARMITSAFYWADPDHRNQTLEGWMTPAYVAYSYGFSKDDMPEILGFAPVPGTRPTLAKIAHEQGVTLQELQERVKAARTSSGSE